MPLDARAAGTMNLARGSGRASDQAAAAWAAEAMAATSPAGVKPAEDGWTPARAGEALVEALRWARYAAGRVGPAGMVSARLPETLLTEDEHEAMGWGLKESADPDDLPPMRIHLTPGQVMRHEAALLWPAVYLVGARMQGSARMVGLWAACKAYKRPFSRAIDGRGFSRPAAYALRDKGLSIIAQCLARDQVPVGRL